MKISSQILIIVSQVETAEGIALASKNGLAFFETSAKSSLRVDEAFSSLAIRTKEHESSFPAENLI